MFCLSALIKADIWRRKSWNTNKLGPNKCHFFSFAFARHAGSTRLHHSQVKKGGAERGGEPYFAQRAKCFQFVMHNQLFAFRVGEGFS